jgi:hypothetical protein
MHQIQMGLQAYKMHSRHGKRFRKRHDCLVKIIAEVAVCS